MRTAEIKIVVPSRSDCVKLLFLGDLHLGSRQTDEGLVEQTSKRLAEDNLFWFDLGDACEFINMSDKRFSVESLAPWMGLEDLVDLPDAQISRYRHFFSKYGHNCLARIEGNHESAIKRKYERNVYRALNNTLDLYDGKTAFELKGCRALGFSGFIRVRFYRVSLEHLTWTLNIFLHHGAGGGKLAGSAAINLERLPMAFDADIYAMGHTHKKLALYKCRHQRPLAISQD